MNVSQATPDAGGLVRTVLIVVVVLVAGWLLLAWAIVKRPLLAIPVAAFTALVLLVGMHDAQALAIYLLGALWIWRRAHRTSFERVIGMRVRSRWVRWWTYERRWRNTMLQSGLGKRTRVRESVPKIQTVTSTRWCTRVLVRMLLGQCTEDYERAAPELGHSFGAASCRVREDRPGRVWLEFTTKDPLAETVPALPVADKVDLEAVPIGRREDGEPWVLQVLGTHLLVAGVMGAGKGSVLWSLLRGLGPEIRDGRVAVWAIDPKGGMELGPGRPLFTRFAVPSLESPEDPGGPYEDIAVLLEDAVRVMQQRCRGFADGLVRKHTPTVAEPLILVVIDEIANLTAYLPDRKVKERINRALGLLLTQGRAPAVVVVGALQDPRREVIPLRNLFPTKVGLRLDSPSEVDMVLGDGAHDQGAACDRIPASLPGVGYVRVDGVREPTRVRAAYVTDPDIAAMVADYAAPRPSLDGEQLFRSAEGAVDAEIIELPARDEERPQENGEREAS
jgi:S-DNA-T family DNA segregation ATPase FtsK/SpoIIIE